jgi:hypothetical protein
MKDLLRQGFQAGPMIPTTEKQLAALAQLQPPTAADKQEIEQETAEIEAFLLELRGTALN